MYSSLLTQFQTANNTSDVRCFYFSLFFRFSAVRWPPRQLLSLRKSTASYRIVSYHGPTYLLNLVARIPIYRFLCYSLYYPYPFQTHTHHFLFYFLHLPFIISIVLACDVIVVYPSICPSLTTRSPTVKWLNVGSRKQRRTI